MANRGSRHTGFAWYRCFVRVPAEWRDQPCRLDLGYISECDETFVNGVRVGATGSFPPRWASGIPALRDYTVPPQCLGFGTENHIAVRVYCSGREDSGGGLIGVQYGMSDFRYREYRFQPDTGASPVSYDRGRWLGEPGRELTLSCARGALSLEGQWQVRRGDDPSRAQWPAQSPSARDQVASEYRRSARQPVGAATEIFSGRARPPAGPRTIWFRTPGRQWYEALPVGNGRLGAMVFGIPGRERLQLSEETVWAGRPAETDRSAAYGAFAATREHLFAERYAEAHRVYAESFLAPNETRSFQTLGTLHLEVETAPSVTDYRRELDLGTAIARVQYRVDETTFTREVFASAVDDLIVLRLACDRGPAINARMWMERIDPTTDSPAVGTETLVEDGCLVQRGPAVHAPGQTDAWDKRPDLSPVDENRGVRFEVRALPVVATSDAATPRVTAEGGRIVGHLIELPVGCRRENTDAAAVSGRIEKVRRKHKPSRCIQREVAGTGPARGLAVQDSQCSIPWIDGERGDRSAGHACHVVNLVHGIENFPRRGQGQVRRIVRGVEGAGETELSGTRIEAGGVDACTGGIPSEGSYEQNMLTVRCLGIPVMPQFPAG